MDASPTIYVHTVPVLLKPVKNILYIEYRLLQCHHLYISTCSTSLVKLKGRTLPILRLRKFDKDTTGISSPGSSVFALPPSGEWCPHPDPWGWASQPSSSSPSWCWGAWRTYTDIHLRKNPPILKYTRGFGQIFCSGSGPGTDRHFKFEELL